MPSLLNFEFDHSVISLNLLIAIEESTIRNKIQFKRAVGTMPSCSQNVVLKQLIKLNVVRRVAATLRSRHVATLGSVKR